MVVCDDTCGRGAHGAVVGRRSRELSGWRAARSAQARASTSDVTSVEDVQFRSIVEQLPLVVYVDELDERSSARYVSPLIERLLGLHGRGMARRPRPVRALPAPGRPAARALRHRPAQRERQLDAGLRLPADRPRRLDRLGLRRRSRRARRRRHPPLRAGLPPGRDRAAREQHPARAARRHPLGGGGRPLARGGGAGRRRPAGGVLPRRPRQLLPGDAATAPGAAVRVAAPGAAASGGGPLDLDDEYLWLLGQGQAVPSTTCARRSASGGSSTGWPPAA